MIQSIGFRGSILQVKDAESIDMYRLYIVLHACPKINLWSNQSTTLHNAYHEIGMVQNPGTRVDTQQKRFNMQIHLWVV